MHAYLPKTSTYYQLFTLEHVTTAPFAVSSIAVVAITMPTPPDGQSPVSFFFIYLFIFFIPQH